MMREDKQRGGWGGRQWGGGLGGRQPEEAMSCK